MTDSFLAIVLSEVPEMHGSSERISSSVTPRGFGQPSSRPASNSMPRYSSMVF
jgi:hypothetical protein